MISTYFGEGRLDSPSAMLAALVIGLAFGFVLERAGFGSSRKLAGIFYFRDMTVLKVMFTAVITAMLGLSYAIALGWVASEQVYALPTIYRSQIIGGLLFGVGFVMSGWCPGTGAVGAASGKLDAVVFLIGTVIGSVGFNEAFGLLQSAHIVPAADDATAAVAFGMSRTAFALLFTLIALGAFTFAEWVERRTSGGGKYLGSPFLKAFSLAFLVAAAALFILPSSGPAAVAGTSPAQLLGSIEAAEDHIEPEDLADRLMHSSRDITLVDVRTPAEYAAFHIRGAVNVPLHELPTSLEPYKNRGWIVLYSNGMTHPAQARDALASSGYRNAYLLTDGLTGFAERCLKPVSLRDAPLSDKDAARVNAWRGYFLAAAPATAKAPSPQSQAPATPQSQTPATATASRGLGPTVETAWLAERLNQPTVRVIDLRPQPKYNTSHIAGSVCLNPESFRGVVGDVSSMLLPPNLLAGHLSLMGIRPTDTVMLVYGNVPEETDLGNGFRDATLVGMGLERVGHANWAILEGGFAKWAAEQRPVTTALPSFTPSQYPVPATAAGFVVDADYVQRQLGDQKTVIVDVRPGDFYRGAKSNEARAGHIPGAVNAPFKADLGQGEELKPTADLAAAYAKLVPTKDTPVIVYCRTGHQASQTFFVLSRLLGYRDVKWYDGSWSEWASRPELPVAK